MNIEKIWITSNWTTQARSLIDGLRKFSEDSNLILMLRHSHRNEPEFLDKVHKLRLTPEGHAIAKKFGESLPKNRSIRIFHSIIWRCEETAENIHNGFKSIGGKSELKGEFSPLYDIGIDNRSFLEQFKNYHFKEILFRWAAGFYLPEEWTPFIQYSQNTAHLIWNQLKDAPERGLDIYVTHDWHLMSLRFGWFGVPPDERWVEFLGGFAFTFEEERILLLDYGQLKSLEIPHWWK
ncbi:MAG: hypothetical protein ACFFDN_26530 [Candidatus Hodarchaeota archaeon]